MYASTSPHETLVISHISSRLSPLIILTCFKSTAVCTYCTHFKFSRTFMATEIKINIFLETTHYLCKHIHNAFHLFQSILPIQKHMSLDHSLRLEWRSISILISILTSSYGQVTCASGWAQYKLKWDLINPAFKRTGAWLQCNAYCLTSNPGAKMFCVNKNNFILI